MERFEPNRDVQSTCCCFFLYIYFHNLFRVLRENTYWMLFM